VLQAVGACGIREGAMVALLTSVGTDMQQAVALTLLFLLILWLCTLPGALVLLLGKRKRPATMEKTAQ